MQQPQQQQMMQPRQQQPRYRSVQLQPQQPQQVQQQQPNQFGFQQPAPPYPRGPGMQPQQQGGQYLPNMMHQGPGPGMNMGPQSSVSMTAQQMLAQVRSPPQPGNVRSPGP